MRTKSILALAAGAVLAAASAQAADLIIAGRDGGYATALSKAVELYKA